MRFALYLVLSFVVIPRIAKTLAARAETLEGNLAEAENLRVQAEAALKAYEDALAEARSRALVLAQEMRADVQAETDRQKAELDTKLAEQAAAADAALMKSRDAAMAGLKDAAAALVDDVIEAIGSDKASDGDVPKRS